MVLEQTLTIVLQFLQQAVSQLHTGTEEGAVVGSF